MQAHFAKPSVVPVYCMFVMLERCIDCFLNCPDMKKFDVKVSRIETVVHLSIALKKVSTPEVTPITLLECCAIYAANRKQRSI